MGSDKQTVFSTEWFSIERERFDGLESLEGKPFYRLKSPDGVMVLALTDAEEIILVKQFRPAFSQYSLELPSGFIDGSESPLQAASRELHEETGFACETLIPLGTGRIMLNRTDSRQFAFFGRGAVKDPDFYPREEIEIVLVDRERFRKLVVEGQFQQLAALALFVLAEWKQNGQFVSSS